MVADRALGTKDEGYVALFQQLAYMLGKERGCGIGIQLPCIAFGKSTEVFFLVPKPFSEIRCWGDFSVPFVYCSLVFAETSRPKPVYEDAISIGIPSGRVSSFDK